MCSMKWASPASCSPSYREPTANITAIDTDARSRIGAVMMRAPLGRRVRRYAPSTPDTVRVSVSTCLAVPGGLCVGQDQRVGETRAAIAAAHHEHRDEVGDAPGHGDLDQLHAVA